MFVCLRKHYGNNKVLFFFHIIFAQSITCCRMRSVADFDSVLRLVPMYCAKALFVCIPCSCVSVINMQIAKSFYVSIRKKQVTCINFIVYAVLLTS